MFRIQSLLIALFVATGLSASCGDDLDCSQDSDCYSSEYCSSGTCLTGSRPNNGAANNGTANNGAVNNGTANNGTTNNGATNNGTTNNGTTNNGATNNGTTNNGSANSCTVNLFDVSCEDDENDRFADSFTAGNVGCLSNDNDELTTINEVRTELLCGHEQLDKYRQSYIGCDTRTFVMEVRFDPKNDMCTADLVLFEFGVDGKNCEESHDEIECVRQPDGGMIATALVNPSNSINGAYINIGKLQDNVHFEYDLTVIVR